MPMIGIASYCVTRKLALTIPPISRLGIIPKKLQTTLLQTSPSGA